MYLLYFLTRRTILVPFIKILKSTKIWTNLENSPFHWFTLNILVPAAQYRRKFFQIRSVLNDWFLIAHVIDFITKFFFLNGDDCSSLLWLISLSRWFLVALKCRNWEFLFLCPTGHNRAFIGHNDDSVSSHWKLLRKMQHLNQLYQLMHSKLQLLLSSRHTRSFRQPTQPS